MSVGKLSFPLAIDFINGILTEQTVWRQGQGLHQTIDLYHYLFFTILYFLML